MRNDLWIDWFDKRGTHIRNLKRLSRRQFYRSLYILLVVGGLIAVIAQPPRNRYWGSESSLNCRNTESPKPGLFDYSNTSGVFGPCYIESKVNFRSLFKMAIFWFSNTGWFYLFLFQRMKLWIRLVIVAPFGFAFTIVSALFLLPWGWH